MEWWQTLALLFGILTLLLLLGLPAGFAFLAINLVGAVVYLGGEPGLMQVVRNGVASITNFSLTPIPFFVLMGEVLFHTGVAMKAIDAAGLRGFRIGDAQVSEKHCNFLLNLGEATSADIEALGEEVRRRVKAHSGVELEWEIQRVGVRG